MKSQNNIYTRHFHKIASKIEFDRYKEYKKDEYIKLLLTNQTNNAKVLKNQKLNNIYESIDINNLLKYLNLLKDEKKIDNMYFTPKRVPKKIKKMRKIRKKVRFYQDNVYKCYKIGSSF